MLNELYNKIKEDKAFRDLFQPISKEELEKRLKVRLECSKYNYLHIADIKGEVIWATDVEGLEPKDLRNILVSYMDDARYIAEEVELVITVPALDIIENPVVDKRYWPTAVKGSFSGSIIVFSNQKLDKLYIASLIINLKNNPSSILPEGTLMVEDVDVNNIRIWKSKEDN